MPKRLLRRSKLITIVVAVVGGSHQVAHNARWTVLIGGSTGRTIMDQMRKYAAEPIGTLWLTFAGCGSAVLASPPLGLLAAGPVDNVLRQR